MAIETGATADLFVDDTKASLAAWRKAPLLPIVTALIGLIPAFDVRPEYGYWTPAFIFLTAFLAAGWLGTQLVWYQRVFDGKRLQTGDLIPLTWSFIARYVWLFCLASIPPFVVLLVLAIKWHTLVFVGSPGGRLGLLAYVLVVQMVGTFMSPALAFSTRKVTRAVPTGLRVLAYHWPGNWKYVVVPAVVGGALSGMYGLVPPQGRSVLDIVSTLVYLVFAGAIARSYLRIKPIES